MDVFTQGILSFKSFYLLSVAIVLTLMIASVLYRLSKKKIKPAISGFFISLIVMFYHLYISNLDWNFMNISKVLVLTLLAYISALGIGSSIAKIARSASDEEERDLTWGRKG